MALSYLEIQNNKSKFIEILRTVQRDNANIEGLVSKLCESDFFNAPCTTQYNNSYSGGLCEHSLKVFERLFSLIEMYNLKDVVEYDSLVICGLLHDMCKMNLYEKYYKNVKEYNDNGSKSDNIGRFDWVSQESYKVKDDVFIYGNREETSEYMVRTFIPLKLEESVAILHHLGGSGYDSIDVNIPKVYEKYTLATLLHCADMMATYVGQIE